VFARIWVRAYNEAITTARGAGDKATGDVLLKILKMEGGHADWGERQRAQIEQMGLQNCLANQTADAAS
jgi:bacterioferritin